MGTHPVSTLVGIDGNHDGEADVRLFGEELRAYLRGVTQVEPITDNQLEHLLDFIGYGSFQANVWFLGMEEAGGGDENIRTRLQFRTVEDCAEAHRLLGITKHHWGNRVIQRTWRCMCWVSRGGRPREMTNRDNIRWYQAERLGRFHGNTLLTELMSIPKPKISVWEYGQLIP